MGQRRRRRIGGGISHSIDEGVNWIDTAAVYGLGHSEEVVARAIESHDPGNDVYIFTKCGLNFHDSGGKEVDNDLRPESIRFECEQSLKRLGIERIDLFQFHWPDESTGTRVEDSWGAMAELIDDGKVRWGGVSNFDVSLLERCESIRHVDSLQPPLSMLNRSARDDVIPWCKEHGTGVIAYSPMASGLLTGKFDQERVDGLDDDDWRKKDDAFQERQLSRNLALVERLRPVAERLGIELPALAVAWTLAVPGVSAAIVGARRPDQVNGWLPASEVELSDGDRTEIEEAIRETAAG